jgi:molybdopterin/thiamine biosynthesis adenylyltransferase
MVPESRTVTADVERFDRQVRWFAQEGVNGPRAQRRLAGSTVLVLGVGGFGSAVAELLARAGVGRLVLVDPDRVEASNLPRQMLYDHEAIGARKAFAAAARLETIAPDLEVTATDDDITCAADVERLVKRYRPSMVVCAADRPPIAIKGWVDEGAFAHGVPVIHGGSRPPLVYVGPMLVPGQTSCYECFLASRVALGADELEAQVNELRNAHPPSFPGVGWCDVAAACFATSQIVALLAGVHPPAILGREIEFDARSFEQEWMDPLPDRGVVRCERCAA